MAPNSMTERDEEMAGLCERLRARAKARRSGLVDVHSQAWRAKHIAEVQECEAAAIAITRLLARLSEMEGQNVAMRGALSDEKMEHDLLKELLSRPEIDEFYESVMLEAAHQRQRWGDAHDRSKSAENWYWLVGYLAGKALRSAIEGNQAKARHHTISSAAALFQWHKAIGSSPNGVGHDADLAPADSVVSIDTASLRTATEQEGKDAAS